MHKVGVSDSPRLPKLPSNGPSAAARRAVRTAAGPMLSSSAIIPSRRRLPRAAAAADGCTSCRSGPTSEPRTSPQLLFRRHPVGSRGAARPGDGRVGGGRHRHAEFRQRRHRCRRQGRGGNHRPQFHPRPEDQGHGQHRLGATGPAGARLSDAAFGAALAGHCRRRRQRRDQAGDGGRRQAAGLGSIARSGHGRRRPAGHAGRHAAL